MVIPYTTREVTAYDVFSSRPFGIKVFKKQKGLVMEQMDKGRYGEKHVLPFPEGSRIE